MEARNSIIGIWDNKEWRYPIISGIASMPFSITIQLVDAGEYVAWPPFLAGLIVGVWTIEKSAIRVGWRSGLVSSIFLLFYFAQFSTNIPYGSQPIFATIYMYSGLAMVGLIYIIVYGALGAIGGMVGDWLSDNFDWIRENIPN